MKKLAIILTHPIQYYAPIFQILAKSQKIQIKVFYTWSQAKEQVEDSEFGTVIQWDIPLLEGYDYTFVENSSKNPGIHRKGIQNPTLNIEIEQWGANAILVFGHFLESHFNAMKYFHGKIPVLFRGDSHLLDDKASLKKIIRHKYLQYVYKHIDFALYVGKNNYDYFRKMRLRQDQLVFAPHAIDNNRFMNNEELDYDEKAQELRQKLNFSDDDIVILYAGKFSNRKGVVNALNSFCVAKENNKNIKLLLFGNGNQEKKLKNIAEERDDIVILPFVNQKDMPIYYRIGDIVMLPSIVGETWGLAINEAMACSRAVIVSSQVGCACDLVEDNYNGYIFESENWKQLEQIFSCLSKQKLQEMGEYSLQKIQGWNFNAIVNSIEQTVNLKSKVLALFGNILGPYGQEKANMEVFNLLKNHNFQFLALVNKECFHEKLQPYFENYKLPFEKIYYCWPGPWRKIYERFFLVIKEYVWGNYKAISYIRKYRPEYIHINNDMICYYFVPTLLFFKGKIIYRIGDAPYTRWLGYRLLWRYFIPYKIDTIVAISKFVADKVKEATYNKFNNIKIIYNYPPQEIKNNTSVTIGIKENDCLSFLYVGQMASLKGVDILVDASIKLCKKYPKIKFSLVGKGEECFIDMLKEKIKKEGFENRINFVGFVHNVSDLYKQCDLHIFPSIYEEPLGNVLLEAKMNKKASIIFKSGGIPELVEHKKNGYICTEKNSSSLQEGIAFYLNNPILMKEHGQNAFNSIEDLKISREYYERKWLDVYK